MGVTRAEKRGLKGTMKELKGKVIWFDLNGYRSGKVVKVVSGKRVGVKRVRVRLAGADPDTGRLGHYGRMATLFPLHLRTAHTYFRGKPVPVA